MDRASGFGPLSGGSTPLRRTICFLEGIMNKSVFYKIAMLFLIYIFVISISFCLFDSVKDNPTIRYSIKSLTSGFDHEKRMFWGSGKQKNETEKIKSSFLSKKELDKLDLKNVNKLMIVAHPDDETLWGGVHLIEDDYLVLCLTNGKSTGNVRYSEFNSVLRKTKDKGIILSYPDAYKFKRVDWKKAGVYEYIQEDIRTVLTYKKWDEVVTHNPEGEYGHIHHIYTNNIVTDLYKENIKDNKLYYFTKYYNKGEMFKVREHMISLPVELFEEKMDLLDLYASQPGAFVKYGQMIKYEKFINADDFKYSI